MNESPGTLELLSSRMDALEKRVHVLEHPDEKAMSTVRPVAGLADTAAGHGEESLQTANIFPLLGRALLGIAGAYGLRAVAESGVMPKAAVAAVAIAYAFAWLAWAARNSKAQGIAPLVYAGTSGALLAPMLWEITLHFRVFTPTVTAGVLTAYAVLATVIRLRDGSSRFAWIAEGVAAITAVALALATHEVLPFIFMLLLALLVVEYARTRGYAQPVWPLLSLLADGAIWGMIFIYSGPQNARAEYPDLSVAALLFPACLLFAINGTSVAVRVILQKKRMGAFEAVQAAVAFLLVIFGVLSFAPRNGTLILGIGCAALSFATYAAGFVGLRQLAGSRSFNVFALWSVALFVVGALWALPRQGAGIALAIAGLSAYLIAAKINSRTLEFHGAIFLCLASLFSGMASYVFSILAGSVPRGPSWAAWIVASCAGAAYISGSDSNDDGWTHQLLRMAPALLAVSMVSALLAHGVLTLATLAVVLNAHHLAFLRTLVISAVSLSLAYAGPRWGWVEMTRLAYAALAFVAAKLLFEDLRQGHMEFIAASIFLFAVTLMAVPRLVRMGAKSHAESHAKAPVLIGN